MKFKVKFKITCEGYKIIETTSKSSFNESYFKGEYDDFDIDNFDQFGIIDIEIKNIHNDVVELKNE